jgi:hypothetical protein
VASKNFQTLGVLHEQPLHELSKCRVLELGKKNRLGHSVSSSCSKQSDRSKVCESLWEGVVMAPLFSTSEYLPMVGSLIDCTDSGSVVVKIKTKSVGLCHVGLVD